MWNKRKLIRCYIAPCETEKHKIKILKSSLNCNFFLLSIYLYMAFDIFTISYPPPPNQGGGIHGGALRAEHGTISFFKGLVAGCHSFYLFFIFFLTYIHSFHMHTIIHRHSLAPLSISSLLESSVGRPSLWCRAKNRTWACLTASRHATNWATPHPLLPDPARTPGPVQPKKSAAGEKI